MIQIKFYKRLRSLLEETGMKQVYLAKKMNVTETAVSHWVNGERIPKVEDVAILAEIFHTTTDYLIGVSDERERR